MRKETNGLPYLFVSLGFALSIWSSSVSSRDLPDDAAGAPGPLAGDSVEYSMNMPHGTQPQQSITLIFVTGMSICFAIFIISYCVAYKVVMTRQGEMNRLYRSRLRGMMFDEQDIYGGAEEEGISTSTTGTGLDASLVSSLPTVQYRSGMLKPEEETKAGGGPLQNVMWVKECAVCLSEYEEGEEMKVLPVCGHCFHKACISMWLSSHSTCPICRLSLRKHAAAMPAADPALGDFSQSTSGPPRGLQSAVDI